MQFVAFEALLSLALQCVSFNDCPDKNKMDAWMLGCLEIWEGSLAWRPGFVGRLVGLAAWRGSLTRSTLWRGRRIHSSMIESESRHETYRAATN